MMKAIVKMSPIANRTLLLLLITGGICGGVPLAVNQSSAQDSPSPAAESPAAEDKPSGPVTEARKRYDASVEAWRKSAMAFWVQFQEYNTGSGETRVSEQLRWAEAESAMRQAMQQTMIAATDLLEESPEDNEVHMFVMRSIGYRSEIDWYEHLDKAAIAGLKSKLTSPQGQTVLRQLVGISAVALCDFDTAEKYLDKEAYPGKDDEIGKIAFHLAYQLEALRQRWEAEEKVRAAERAADDLPRVVLKTTRGEVILELFENEAPNTVASFISLVEDGFYDRVPFYQVIRHELVQTGDQDGDGSGKADYRIADEAAGVRGIFRGSLVMAKMPNPNFDPKRQSEGDNQPSYIPDTASSQFLIALLPFSPAHRELTCFGRVVDGMGAVSTLNEVTTKKKKDDKTPNRLPDLILEAKVVRKRDHQYKPETMPF